MQATLACPGHNFGAEVHQRLRATEGRCKRNRHPSTAHGMLSALWTNGAVDLCCLKVTRRKPENLCLDGCSRGVWFCPDTRDNIAREILFRLSKTSGCHCADSCGYTIVIFFEVNLAFGSFVVSDLWPTKGEMHISMMHLPKD